MYSCVYGVKMANFTVNYEVSVSFQNGTKSLRKTIIFIKKGKNFSEFPKSTGTLSTEKVAV